MKKALIVVDMQNDFIDGALGSIEAQGIVEKVREKIEGFDGEVVFTLDAHDEDYLDTQAARFPLHQGNKWMGNSSKAQRLCEKPN